MEPESGKSLSKFQSIIRTRNTNKGSHPGKVVNDARQKHRSPQEMEKVHAEETRIREEKDWDKVQKIQQAAQIEDRLRKEDIDRRASNCNSMGHAQYHPGHTVPPTATEGTNRASFLEPKASDPVDAEDPDTSTGDEYSPPPVEADDGESEVEGSDLELEDEEDDKPKKSKKGKEPKPSRVDIRAARHVGSAVPASLTTTARFDGKRKADDWLISTDRDALNPKTNKKVKGPQGNSALLPGWNSSSSRVSASHSQADEEDDSMVQPGGLVHDEETDDLERKAISGLKQGNKKILLNTIKITNSKPMVQSTKKAQRGGAAKWKLTHLPLGASDMFTNSLVPLVKMKAGTVEAWAGLTYKQIQSLVNKVFPEENHIVKNDDVWCGLVAYRLSNWRNGFLTHASNAVKRMLEEAEFEKGDTDMKDFVELFTEIQGDPPTAPFHWREWNVDEISGKVSKKGCFQNELIMYTLAHAYFAEYDEIPDPHELDKLELPGGALVLSLQAVEHAFKFWKQGKFINSDDKSTIGHFSGDIYGDNIKRKNGEDVRVLNAGQYKKTIENFSVEKHWVPIFEAANEVLNASRRKKKGRSQSALSQASSEATMADIPEYILVSDDE
ncbi:hypothetical protein BYT27DRAFT_7094606 [Phlegmacium glaucopus]|nr:hypothetical protein BYT27DRAFT_7094606 [Phlegmacium glaucopus]